MNTTTTATVLQIEPAQLRFWQWGYALIGTLLGTAISVATWFAIDKALALPDSTPFAWTMLSGALLAWPGWYYAGRRFQRYDAEWHPGKGVVLHDGVWWQTESWIPVARLQHIDVQQGPLDRRWGTARLTLYTAGTHHHRLTIKGLSVDQAHAMREALLPRLAVSATSPR